MKPTSKRKELQTKLMQHIAGFTSGMAINESKKLKKSIRKASKIIAKAIVKNSEENEVELSLHTGPEVKKEEAVKTGGKRKKTIRKKTATRGRKRQDTTKTSIQYPAETIVNNSRQEERKEAVKI